MNNDLLVSGHRTCAGCGATIAIRILLRVAGKDTIVCNATGCLEVATTPYPETSWAIPWIHSAFENVSAVASGVESALKAMGNEHTNVIAIGGDGSTFDIGFGSLSGMLERGHNVLYVCYDNEAYMNTGIQRSGATPLFASTTTSPPGKASKGNDRPKKDLVEIAAAHSIPYAATASIAYPADLKKKIKKALSLKGPKLLHIHAPCPTGWGHKENKTVEYAKLAVETGMWILYEIENRKPTITFTPAKRKPLKEYLGGQKRFRHISDEDIKKIEESIEEEWKRIGRNIDHE